MDDLPFFDGAVLHDPAAAAVAGAVERHNLKLFLIDHQLERISHFARRIAELGRSPRDTLIVVLQVDDPHGGALADALMPGHDWQPTRDLGMVPYARGLATRQPIQEALTSTMPDAAKQLLAVDGCASHGPRRRRCVRSGGVGPMTRPCIIIEYQVADALTEVRTVLSIREEKMIADATCCRLTIIPSDDQEESARISTEILISTLLGERVRVPVGKGASERLLRALFDMAATSSNGRPVSVLLTGTQMMNLGDLKETS